LPQARRGRRGAPAQVCSISSTVFGVPAVDLDAVASDEQVVLDADANTAEIPRDQVHELLRHCAPLLFKPLRGGGARALATAPALVLAEKNGEKWGRNSVSLRRSPA